jgi:prephenate dehydratase
MMSDLSAKVISLEAVKERAEEERKNETLKRFYALSDHLDKKGERQ